MLQAEPIKTITGTWEEIARRRDELPSNALLELRIFAPGAVDENIRDFGGKTAGDIIREIGFIEGGPSDLSTNPKYMEGFGINPRR